jgi:hypothetical protein
MQGCENRTGRFDQEPGQDPVRVEHKNGPQANRLSDRKTGKNWKTGGSTCGPVLKILLDFLNFFKLKKSTN